MPSIKIGNFRLSIVDESKHGHKYSRYHKNPAPPEQIARNQLIFKLWEEGRTQQYIASKLGLQQARVSRILQNMKKNGIGH